MNTRILFLVTFFFLSSLFSFAQKKPNVILIFPDNLGVGEVAAYGGARGIPTPNIDRIGNEGAIFTSFYAAAPVCTPSRASIFTAFVAIVI